VLAIMLEAWTELMGALRPATDGKDVVPHILLAKGTDSVGS